jgi:hypothetical protein
MPRSFQPRFFVAALATIVLFVGLLAGCATVAPPPPTAYNLAPNDTTAGTGAAPAIDPNHVTLYPGQAVAAIVAASPAGTTFVFQPGTYSNVSIVPLPLQTFVGLPGAILNGAGQAVAAFSGSATYVTIDNLTITNYANGAQQGAINGDSSYGWNVFHNTISYTGGTGLRIGNYMNARNNWIHHNQQLGIGGGGVDINVSYNDISYNNYADRYDPAWEAGGTKFALTVGLAVIDNDVHNNVGPGLWTDIGNTGTLYYGNYVHDNDYAGAASSAGIFHEISGSAIIWQNTVVHNGASWTSWGWNGGIQIAASNNVQIFDNVVLDNPNGITLLQQNRYSEAPLGLLNIKVHDNTIRTTGLTGAFVDTGENIYATRNITFANNTFLGTGRFQWSSGAQAVPAWVGTIVSAMPQWAAAQLGAATSP